MYLKFPPMKGTKGIGLITAFSMIVGTVIGSGIFVVSSDVVKAVPSQNMSLLVWFTAGVISLMGCLIFSELGTLFPKSGGQYIYLCQSFGPLVGYLYGWTVVAVIQTGSIAAVAGIFATFANGVLGKHAIPTNILGSAVIIGFTILNIFGLKKATSVLDFLTGLKTLALILIPLTIIFLYDSSSTIISNTAIAQLGTVTPAGFGIGLIAAFWAYDGWNSLVYVAGDMENPKRNIPIATVGGISLVIFLYLAVNWSYQRALTLDEISTTTNVAAAAINRALGGKLIGNVGSLAVSFAILCSTLATVNAFIIAGSRLIQAMAIDGGLHKSLAHVSGEAKTPINAFLVQMIWALALLWSGKYDQLYTCVIGVSFVFYGLTAYSVIIFRDKLSTTDRPFKVPLYPAIVILYITFCALFTLNTVLEKPIESLAGLILVLIGVPAFYLNRKAKASWA